MRNPTVQPFMKMKLVPAGAGRANKKTTPHAPFSYDLEKQVRYADPIGSAMAQSLPYIDGLPAKQRKYLGSDTTNAVQNAHLQRYKQLERLRESSEYTTPPVLQPAPPELLPPPLPSVHPQAKPYADDRDEGKAFTMWDINLPKKYSKKFGRVLTQLDEMSDSVGRTRAGELVLDGHTLRGTNYSSAFRSLYVNTPVPAPGARELLLHLKRRGVAKTLFSSKYAQMMYGQAGSGRRRKRVSRSGSRIGSRAAILRVY
jgi:hypothetical protein